MAIHSREVPPPELAYAGIKLEIQCASCERFVPVTRVAVHEPMPCPRCRHDNVVDDDLWRRVLQLGHAVADLMAEHPEGRRRYLIAIDQVNPFHEAGKRHSGTWVAPQEWPAWRAWLPETARAWVTSGQPMGPDSGEPLDVRSEGDGRLKVRTSRGEPARYAVSTDVVALHKGFLGVIDDEHQADRDAVEVPRDARGPDVGCPACGATLRLDGQLRRVRCQRCDTVAHIPASVRHALQPDPKPDLWWFAYEGRSPYRKFLERDPRTKGQTDDRAVEASSDAEATWLDRLASVALTLAIPTGLLLLAGMVLRASVVAGWLTTLLGGS
ncbi:MAG: hypothetical protein AAGA48_24185 [Myxococcota bacterium]